MKKDIDIICLGCSKNLVDAERLMGELDKAGYRCHPDPETPNSPTVVINTCGFIGDAKEESINTILSNAARKTNGEIERLYVMGCLSERYLKELQEEIPEVDKWFGKFDYMQLAAYLTSRQETYCTVRHLTTPSHYAYLKISEGCNRMCSYCAIPIITGRHKSVPMEALLAETRALRDKGVKELNIIAQDLSFYGLDLYGTHKLPELVERIAETEGIEWIRLHYAYPTDFPIELLDVMNRHDNICKYLDIALQHCTDNMLNLMHRHITANEQDALIAQIRERVPGICLRTTLMTGHPGETEEDFEALKEWVRTMRFDRMGVFTYSAEEGTYSYKHYKDAIPQEVKEQRAAELMDIQQGISAELLNSQKGKETRIIIDRKEGDYYIGRTEHDSPEVDCEVLIPVSSTEKRTIKTGKFYNVIITNTEDFDLYAQLC